MYKRIFQPRVIGSRFHRLDVLMHFVAFYLCGKGLRTYPWHVVGGFGVVPYDMGSSAIGKHRIADDGYSSYSKRRSTCSCCRSIEMNTVRLSTIISFLSSAMV